MKSKKTNLKPLQVSSFTTANEIKGGTALALDNSNDSCLCMTYDPCGNQSN